MLSVKGYKELIVWQRSVALADEVYALTENFPRKETYGLASQMQRAAVSIASNIAEGCARNGSKEFINFLGISKGSSAELNTQNIIASRRSYITESDKQRLEAEIEEIDKMLHALITRLRSKVTS